MSAAAHMLSSRRTVHLLLALLCGLAGCASLRPVDQLNVLALGKAPIRIGVTDLDLTPPLMLPKRTLFQENLEFHLNEPLSFELMTPRQIRVHLGTGRLKFAMLSAADFAEIAPSDNARVLAVPVNDRGTTQRRGLIIVAPKSKLSSVGDLKGRRFHFLPRADVLNEAARGILMERGVAPAEVDKGVLGLGLDTYHISSLEVAKSVVLEDRAAGVIDEGDYESWAATGGSLALLLPSKDQVRVIARTVIVPEGPIVVSKETSPELTEKVSEYLFKVLPQRKLILASLGYRGMAPPLELSAYEPFFALHRRLNPVATEPSMTSEPSEVTLPRSGG